MGTFDERLNAKQYNNNNYNKTLKITALDPALPLFINAAPADKLDATDAEFVDVYHSNAFVQGQIERCGTVDFYMNGGICTYYTKMHIYD